MPASSGPVETPSSATTQYQHNVRYRLYRTDLLDHFVIVKCCEKSSWNGFLMGIALFSNLLFFPPLSLLLFPILFSPLLYFLLLYSNLLYCTLLYSTLLFTSDFESYVLPISHRIASQWEQEERQSEREREHIITEQDTAASHYNDLVRNMVGTLHITSEDYSHTILQTDTF